MKLTKKDKEFLNDFAVGLIANTLITQLTHQGQQVTPEAAETIVGLLQGANLVSLTDAMAVAIADKEIDIKRLQKVEKYLKTEDVREALTDAQMIGGAVHELITDVLTELRGIISQGATEEA